MYTNFMGGRWKPSSTYGLTLSYFINDTNKNYKHEYTQSVYRDGETEPRKNTMYQSCHCIL